jgi:lipopolysaccharide export system protein LptA
LAAAIGEAAPAQDLGLGLGARDGGKPIGIEAEDGIEWQQRNRVYIARGNAKATRGQATVYADTLKAFYRPVCAGERAATAADGAAAGEGGNCPGGAPPPEKPGAPTPPAGRPADPAASGATEVYRLEAEGNVRIATEQQTAYGDHAVYDLARALLVLTGKHLKLETQRDTVTARDSLEWYDHQQLAVARGDAVAVREGKRLRGDVLTSEVVKDEKGSSHISRINAEGNVLVSSLDQIARGDTGVYNVDTGVATLAGRVTLTRGENELRGQYGVVDLNNHVSRLLSAPPNAKLTEGKPARVEGLVVPRRGTPQAEAPAR